MLWKARRPEDRFEPSDPELERIVLSRRRFLFLGAAGLAVAAAPKILLPAIEETRVFGMASTFYSPTDPLVVELWQKDLAREALGRWWTKRFEENVARHAYGSLVLPTYPGSTS